MKIISRSDAINITRDDGTDISYYIFDEHEVHYGELQPGITQPWYHHTIINEALYIIEGKALLHYLEYGQKKQGEVGPGDVVQVESTPHTFSNPFQKVCKMLAFRFIPDGIDKREIIKNDKVLHPELE